MNRELGADFLLSPFRVLDLTREEGYYLCSKILGDLGAEVVRLEKSDVKRSFWWYAYNYNKKVVSFDIEKEKEKLLQFVAGADFLVESFPPGYLDSLGLGYDALKKLNHRLIMTSITPFGQTGPYRDLKVSDIEIMAMSGVLNEIGDPDRPPVRISFPQAHLVTSAEAAVGTMTALCQRELTGEGQQVDVSAQESVNCIANSVNRWKREGTMSRRIGGYHGPMPGNTLEVGEVKYSHPKHRQIWECKDGHVAFLIHPGTRGAHNNRALAKYLEMDGGLPPILRNIDWETIDWGQTSPEQLAQIWDAFARFFARHTRRELYQIALKERIEFFPGNTVADVIKEEQLEARGFWQERKVPELMGKTLKFPGPFAQIRFSPVSVQKPETNLNKKQGQPARPFDGVKVLDFSWIYTGPMTTLWLAAYGAEVIKVESSSHLDTGRRGGGLGFVAWNSSKKSVTLNLKHPDGKKLARRLIKWADIVVENFAPGVMQRLGFGYDDLVKINPQIIMLSASMFGANGPHAAQRGLGQELTSLAAFNELTGWPDRTPVTAHGAYTDYVACRLTGATLFAVLHYRRRTGRGCYIDLSQFEASLHFLAPLILEYQATGKLLSRMGNRSLTDSPHGVFPCKGEDRWCAISVSSDSEWQAFCEALGRPDWTKDPRFDTFETRKQNENELENLISQWTTQLSAEEVMSCLQKAGVKAAVVANQADLFKDPQLSYRKHFVPVKHSQLGEYYHADSGFRLQQATPIVTMAPLFGEHNKSVATQLLGVSEDEFNNYLKAGALQ